MTYDEMTDMMYKYNKITELFKKYPTLTVNINLEHNDGTQSVNLKDIIQKDNYLHIIDIVSHHIANEYKDMYRLFEAHNIDMSNNIAYKLKDDMNNEHDELRPINSYGIRNCRNCSYLKMKNGCCCCELDCHCNIGEDVFDCRHWKSFLGDLSKNA